MNTALHHITNDGVWFALGVFIIVAGIGALGGLIERIVHNRERDYNDRQLRYNYYTLDVPKQKEIAGYEID